MSTAEQSLLGQETQYDQDYSVDILFPLDRDQNRCKLGIGNELPFQGEDVWTCYELSWLHTSGKPQVAIANFYVPCQSPNMIESKSFKLYLNSINHLSFASEEILQRMLVRDLSAAVGAQVRVEILKLDDVRTHTVNLTEHGAFKGLECIDDIDAEGFEYLPKPSLLKVIPGAEEVNESLYSNLLRSNCPVTGQPDWGTVVIHYSGQQIDRESLLKYIVSFRQCQDFHEHCVETIFTDLMKQCRCDSLSVYARYTRRGGLDINPYRSTFDLKACAPDCRATRQ